MNIWDRNYYDHIIRDEDELRKIWDYIDTNPLRWEYDRYYTVLD
jgi:putative transposase